MVCFIKNGRADVMECLNALFLELEYQHLKPENRRSSQRLKEIIAEDFLEIGSSGKLMRRSDFDYEDDLLNADEYLIDTLEARSLSNDCVLTVYQLENKTRGVMTRRSSIWKKVNSNWVLSFHQGTKVTAELSNGGT